MESKTCLVLSVVIAACFLAAVHSERSNCGTGRSCDNCPEGYYGYVDLSATRRIKVCCSGCSSKYFTFFSKPRPTCTCHFDRLVNDPTCWKGEQCGACKESSTLNGMPICCSSCGNGSMILSPTSCSCRGS